ncbi:kinase-like domain-containing protein, partial [Hyaloraphidium curvatum]
MHNLTRDGRVLRAVDADGTVVVLKKFAVGREDHMRRLYGQIALLHRLKHMHVVTVTGVFQTRESVYVRMPSYRGGDLESLLAGNGRPRSLHNVLRILGDVLLGVRFFHDQDLVHGDIKPSNIFLTRDGRAVLGDFDGVRVVNATMTIGGTIAYWAPELVSGTSLRFSKETDIYALGLVARRMFSGL